MSEDSIKTQLDWQYYSILFPVIFQGDIKYFLFVYWKFFKHKYFVEVTKYISKACVFLWHRETVETSFLPFFGIDQFLIICLPEHVSNCFQQYAVGK